MDDQTASALERAFPGRTVERVDAAAFSWNALNRTVRVAFADGETCYLKLAVDGDGSRIERERAVLEYVAANRDLPVPRVLASDADGSPPFLATAAVSGEILLRLWADADRETRATLARKLGRALAILHGRGFERHGQIVGGGADALELAEAPWTDVLLERIAELRSISTSNRFDHHFDAVRAAVESRRDLLDDAPAALVHGDPWGPNCFRSDAGIGFLDWEIAHVGDPARELHGARDQQLSGPREDAPERLVTALYDAYREQGGSIDAGFEDRRPVYEAVQFLGYVGFVDETAEYLDEPRDELVDWMRTEMERRLAGL